MRRQVVAYSFVAILLTTGIAITRVAPRGHLTLSIDDIPVAQVKRGDLDIKVYTSGELRAQNPITLSAPPVAGGGLEITFLLSTGSPVKKNDVVIEFDRSEQRYKLEQSRSELQQAEEEIIKARSEAAVQSAQDQVALLKARYDFRKAQLEVQKDELVSLIDAKKNDLGLRQAQRGLAELEQDMKSHRTTGQARVDLAKEKWNKAKLSMDLAQQNIEKMRIVTPASGLFAVEKNTIAMGEVFFSGEALPDFREGDQVQPGTAIARVIGAGDMELWGKVSELERANVAAGQSAEAKFYALPDKIFRGIVTSAAGTVQHQFWETDAASKFDVSIQLTESDSRLRPGLTAQMVIFAGKKTNSLYIPRQAIFLKDGKETVYLKKAFGFEQFEIRIASENESRAAIEGLREGDAVALVDITAPRKAPENGTVPAVGGVNP